MAQDDSPHLHGSPQGTRMCHAEEGCATESESRVTGAVPQQGTKCRGELNARVRSCMHASMQACKLTTWSDGEGCMCSTQYILPVPSHLRKIRCAGAPVSLPLP
eukprot:360946-Chlamydomonas_euryale.AAC.6